MEADVLAATEPTHIVLTSALYENLDYGPGHFAAARGAIFGGETPNPLYQLPVTIEQGAHHAWRIKHG